MGLLAVPFVILGRKKKAKDHNTDGDVDKKESVHSFTDARLLRK